MFYIFIKSTILLIIIQVVFSETIATASDNCVLPNQAPLEALQFRVHPHNRTIDLGSSVENFEIVHIQCKDGKILQGQQSLICKNGEWSYIFPTCENYCNGTLLEQMSFRAICDYRDNFIECPKRIAIGTYVQLHCTYGYKYDQDSNQFLRCLPDGTFDKTPKRCEPLCGQIAPHHSFLSKEGTKLYASIAPWHVAIYMENGGLHDYICGGSIISSSVIISAAHCFWNEATQVQFNATNLQVVAGRSSRNYSNEQTKYSQVIKVLEVHIPESYRGKDEQYREDIAFLVLAQPLTYAETIAPVCFPKDLRSSAPKYMLSNRDGVISIFGRNNQLERIPVKTLAYHDCIAEAALAADKFCAFAADIDVVWYGNSGAGFLTANTEPLTNTVQYHFRGVLSHTAYSKQESSRKAGQGKVAIADIFSLPEGFKRKLLSALKKDEMIDSGNTQI